MTGTLRRAGAAGVAFRLAFLGPMRGPAAVRDAVAVGAGAVAMGVYLAHHFGRRAPAERTRLEIGDPPAR